MNNFGLLFKLLFAIDPTFPLIGSLTYTPRRCRRRRGGILLCVFPENQPDLPTWISAVSKDSRTKNISADGGGEGPFCHFNFWKNEKGKKINDHLDIKSVTKHKAWLRPCFITLREGILECNQKIVPKKRALDYFKSFDSAQVDWSWLWIRTRSYIDDDVD